MPLQWLQLDLSRYDRPRVGVDTPQQRTPISEVLLPQQRTPITQGSGVSGRTSAPMSLSESAKDRSSRQAKANKEEEQRWRDYYEEMGRKSSAKYEDMQKRYQEHLSRQHELKVAKLLGRAPAEAAAPTLTKENMPEAAMEVWKFISTLEPESQKFFIQQLKQKEQPTGYVETAGKRVEVPGSVGMYGHLVDQGLIDPATDTVIEKEREFEKGTFIEMENGDILNTATNEVIARAGDDPEVKVDAIVKQIRDDALAVTKADPTISLKDATHDAGIDYGLSEEEAVEIAKFTGMPEGEKKKNAFIEWFKNWDKRVRQYGREMQEKYTPKAKPAFNEANVASLVPVISDDVTEAERAHLKSQGASDADIDEAIRRKTGE